MKTNVYYEFAGQKYEEKKIFSQIRELWLSAGNKSSELKALHVYIKPEDEKAYYVINDDITGSIAL